MSAVSLRCQAPCYILLRRSSPSCQPQLIIRKYIYELDILTFRCLRRIGRLQQICQCGCTFSIMASTNSVPSPFAEIAQPRFSKGAFLVRCLIGGAETILIALKAIQWTGVVLSLSFMIFRVYVRLRLFRRLFPDDGLVVAAWLCYVALGIIFQTQINSMWIAINLGSNRQEQLSPDYIERVASFSHLQIGTWVLSLTALWLVKFSFLLFFRKLGNHVRRQRILWWAIIGFTSASYVVCISLGAFNCWTTADANALGIR